MLRASRIIEDFNWSTLVLGVHIIMDMVSKGQQFKKVWNTFLFSKIPVTHIYGMENGNGSIFGIEIEPNEIEKWSERFFS